MMCWEFWHLLLPINTCHLGLLFLTLEDEAAKTAQDSEQWSDLMGPYALHGTKRPYVTYHNFTSNSSLVHLFIQGINDLDHWWICWTNWQCRWVVGVFSGRFPRWEFPGMHFVKGNGSKHSLITLWISPDCCKLDTWITLLWKSETDFSWQ